MEYPFSDLMEQAIKYPAKTDICNDPVISNFSEAVEGSFIDKLDHVDELSEAEVIRLIVNNIDTIAHDIMVGDTSYAKYFTNIRFLSIFTRVCNSRPITSVIRITCNMVIYDYFTSDDNNREVKRLMLDLAEAVNKKQIELLKSKGLSDSLVKNLVIARYSSIREDVNSARLNFVICQQEPELMVPDTIVYIYETLYDNISDLFKATMFEAYSAEDKENLGEFFMEIYDRVGMVVLTIVNNMTTSQIREVLTRYRSSWEDKGYPAVRFSLRSLSADFERIANVVEDLYQRQIYIP